MAAGQLFGILRRALKDDWASLVGTLIFAVHPIQTEAVAYVGVMNHPLAGMLSLLAMHQYLVATDPTSLAAKGQRACVRVWVIGTVALLLAMLAKPLAVVAPPMAFVLDLAINRRTVRKSVMSIIPWLAITVPFALLVRWMQKGAETAAVPMHFRIVVAGDALLFYTRKLLWPVNLTLDYGRTPYYLATHGIGLPRPLTVLFVLTAVIANVRQSRLLLAAIALSLIGVLPNLGLVPFDYQRWSTVSDRYFYLSMVGVALAIGVAVKHVPRSKYAFAAALVVIAVLSEKQITTWRDGETMARHTLAVNPDSWMACNNLAVTLAQRSPNEAIELCRHALAVRQDVPDTWNTIGILLGARGDLRGMLEAFNHAHELNPGNEKFATNLDRAQRGLPVIASESSP